MRKRLVSLLFAGIMACSVIGSGVTTFAAENDSHINLALFTYIEGMDPATDWCGWNLTRGGVGETLVTVNENMEIVGQLADEWEQVDDTTYRFHIRQGVKFSNGTELTPEIVKDSIQRSIDNNSRGGDLKIANIEVDGENVVFTTDGAYSAFVSQLTEPMTVIVDTTADTSNYDTMPICTGPYAVSEYVSEEKIDLAQGPDATALNRVENNDDINIVKVTGTRENDFELNCHEGNPLSDKNLRLALSYAVDRDVVAQVAGNGYSSPISTAFPPSVGYDSEDVNGQVYDLDKAKECLEAAGYSDSDGDGLVDKDGENLSLTISIANGSSTAVSETLQDMWKQIGVDVQIEMLENVSDKRASGDFDMLVSPNWQTVNAGDGQKYLMNRWSDGGSDNYSGYHSDEFQSVLDKLDAAFTQEDRVSAFVEAQQILADDAPAIWMYANDNVTLVNSKLENVTVFPIDYYLVTNKWTLAE